MKIAIASDHAGFRYKTLLAQHLRERGHEVVDFGTSSVESVDYPDFIRPAAAAVARGECERGIVLGGSGNGEAMAANRFRGVRCALCSPIALNLWSPDHRASSVPRPSPSSRTSRSRRAWMMRNSE